MLPSVHSPMITFSESQQDLAGSSIISFSVPSDLSSQFIIFFDSMYSLFKYSLVKARHQKAVAMVKDPRLEEIRKQEFQIFSDSVLTSFDGHRLAGLSVKDSINAVKKDRSGTGITCYLIELIARQNGRLRKVKTPHV